jgi:ABC-2 type transport system ATP-binding protein
MKTQETAVLITQGLCKAYGKVQALHNLNMKINAGEIVALLGANGAGKTTTVKLLLGLIRPSAGEVTVFGLPAGHMQIRGRIGYSPESRRFHEFLTVAETLRYYSQLSSVESSQQSSEVEQSLKLTGLTDLQNRKAGKLSKGEAQRLSVAQSLLGKPPILLLDEPTAGLDPVGRIAMREMLKRCREEGKTVLLNSHILSDVELVCDRALILHKGVQAWQGQLDDIATGHQSVELHAEVLTAEMEMLLRADGFRVLHQSSHWEISPCPPSRAPRVVELISGAGGRITALIPRGNSLEDLFIEVSGGTNDAGDC